MINFINKVFVSREKFVFRLHSIDMLSRTRKIVAIRCVLLNFIRRELCVL